MEIVKDNPFAALFSSEDEILLRKKSVKRQLDELNALLARIFLVTLSESLDTFQAMEIPRCIVYLPHMALAFEDNPHLSLENYSLCVEERLQLSGPDLRTVESSKGNHKGLYSREHVVESSSIRYLAHCYLRAEQEIRREEVPRRVADKGQLEKETKQLIVVKCKQQVVEMGSAIVIKWHSKPASQMTSETNQFVGALVEAVSSGSSDFFKEIADLHAGNFVDLRLIFDPVLNHVIMQLNNPKMSTVNLNQHTNILEFFSSSENLAKVLISNRYWVPQNPSGREFEHLTVLGKFLAPSSIKEFQDFFAVDRELYKQEVEDSTASIRHQLEHINGRTHKIFAALLRLSPVIRKNLISWLTLCLETNNDRGKMASLTGLGMGRDAGDGFFLNLSWIMLKLCLPFLSKDGVEFANCKASLIDVTYCGSSDKEAAMSLDPGGAMVDFSQDAKLVTCDSDEATKVKPNVPFNFVTHCFFLTHKTLMLGMTAVIEKLKNILRQYNHTSGPYRRIFSAQLLGIQAHLFHPTLIDLCLRFYSTTAQWMVNLVLSSSDGQDLPMDTPAAVRIIPECLVDNLATMVRALRQMESQVVLSADQCTHFISLATIFMRSARFVQNPHIRAKLAEFVHFIIYRSPQKLAMDLEFSRLVLDSHSLAKTHLLSSLLSIFIEIEFTGESMEFEDKFVYRLPMYEVLEFIWELPSYRPSIESLAVQVLESTFEADTPLFLKFMNMMINDATVQLDEALSNLQIIKDVEDLKRSEGWEALSKDDKKAADDQLREAEMMAKNRNQLSSQTVHALCFITKDTSKPFVTPSMVNRIASMLNYVLNKLVGKESKHLKVSDTSKYFFDPRALVTGVVSVYINLSQEKQFPEAVARDDRSFSMDLFLNAEKVISRVAAERNLLTKWRELREEVERHYKKVQDEETIVEDAPDEFLDPLTSELMEEPVILPSSGMTMDKKNLVRHLLSNSDDPFNREYLTLAMVEPNHDLLEKIKAWKQEKGLK